jgi:outer membrane protein OmpA-like peptidoglycan-associated protein
MEDGVTIFTSDQGERKMTKNLLKIVGIACLSASLLACATATPEQKGTGVGAGAGAAVGAILGQAIGQDTESTLIGAGIGAAVGALAGNRIAAYMDRQERDLRAAVAQSDAVNVQRIQESDSRNAQARIDVLTATFKAETMFDFDSATLKPGAYGELERVADVLKRYPDTTIVVEGHTDSRGSEAYNQTLSERRAEAVRTALVGMGVAPERIDAIGYGESRPISSSDAMNRRVTITIRPQPEAFG